MNRRFGYCLQIDSYPYSGFCLSSTWLVAKCNIENGIILLLFLFFHMMTNIPLLLHLLLHHVVGKLRCCVPAFRNLQNHGDSILFISGIFSLLIVVFITICYSCYRIFNSKCIWIRTSSNTPSLQ